MLGTMSVRRHARGLAAAGLACLALAPAAQAAKGDGPYTPFPEDPGHRAADFVNKLNHARSGGGSAATGRQGTGALTPAQLATGVTIKPRVAGRGRHAGASGPGRHAGGADGRVQAGAAAGTPFDRAGFAEASDPPSPSALPFILIGAALAAAGAALAARGRRQGSAG